jgi:hypothetical protein
MQKIIFLTETEHFIFLANYLKFDGNN